MDNISEKIESIISLLRQNKFYNEDQIQALQRKIQEISDSLDKVTMLKEAYIAGDIQRCVSLIYWIAIEDHFSDQHGIRKILYTDNQILPNPMNYKVTDDEIMKVKQIVAASISYFTKVGDFGSDGHFGSGIYSQIANQLSQILIFYDVIYCNYKKNEEHLTAQPYLNYSLSEIIRSVLVYHQDQMRLARRVALTEQNSQSFITGMEGRVADRPSDMYSNIKVSMEDNFEQLIEQMDALFRYIYYLKPDDFEDLDSWSKEFLAPYESVDFEELSLLCMGDVFYTKLENRFRYAESKITTTRNLNGVPTVVFGIGDVDSYKIHIAAGLRREHNFSYQMGIMTMLRETLQKKWGETVPLPSKDGEDGDGALVHDNPDMLFFQEYLLASERLDINDVESFHFNKAEYARLEECLKPHLYALEICSKKYDFKCVFSNITVKDYLNAYVYLYTFSKVYYVAALKQMDENDLATYSVLTPFVNTKYLYQEFSNLYSNLGYKKAKKLIDCFIFDNKISRDKHKGDLFSRPLVKVNKEKILLSEALIHQINLERSVEVLLESHDVDISYVGKDMERRVIKALSTVDAIAVNTAHIDFMAYDSRNVEFDCIATFDNYLVLIEMKALFVPYSDFELFKRRKTLKEGIKQVNRRAKIVQYDWEKIKKAANIKLPQNPYPEERIIKIVCTDIGDFTSLEIDGVIITDESTLLKYFKNPYINGTISTMDGIDNIREQILWKQNGRPTVDEFIEYLHNPDTINFILDTMGESIKPLYLHNGCNAIAFEDITIDCDPWAKLGKQYFLKNDGSTSAD